MKKNKKIKIIIYHGLFSDCNDKLIKKAVIFFKKFGYDVYSPNFLNSKLKFDDISIKKYLEIIEQTTKKFENDYEIVNIGHSFAGFLLIKYFLTYDKKNINIL